MYKLMLLILCCGLLGCLNAKRDTLKSDGDVSQSEESPDSLGSEHGDLPALADDFATSEDEGVAGDEAVSDADEGGTDETDEDFGVDIAMTDEIAGELDVPEKVKSENQEDNVIVESGVEVDIDVDADDDAGDDDGSPGEDVLSTDEQEDDGINIEPGVDVDISQGAEVEAEVVDPCEVLNCDDNNACTVDTCVPFIGCFYLAVSCNDNNSCTNDSCDPVIGCIYVNNIDACDDQNACTSNDVCKNGICAGTAWDFSDGDVCTDDSCDPVTGVVYILNSAPCDDGDHCTDGDKCQGGKCKSGALINCDDKNMCTIDSCDPATGCFNKAIAECCLSQVDCKDGNICTDDVCTDNWCSYKPILGCCIKKSDCDDGNICTADTCSNNKCQHALVLPPVCCNVDSECSDDNVCNGIETCADNKCLQGILLSCNDDNLCTNDDCDLAKGCVYSSIPDCCSQDSECDDLDICNGSEVCKGHVCIHLYNVVGDKDFDCVPDEKDNCPAIYNTDQVDIDADGTGDVCDSEKNCTYSKTNWKLPAGFWNFPGLGGCVSICVKKDVSAACLYLFNTDGNCTMDLDDDGVGTDLGDCKELQKDVDPFWCWVPSGPPPSCLNSGWTAVSI